MDSIVEVVVLQVVYIVKMSSEHRESIIIIGKVGVSHSWVRVWKYRKTTRIRKRASDNHILNFRLNYSKIVAKNI